MHSSSDTFNHPYSPYDIQLQFMRALYACIEERKVGIFESPTGTVRHNTFFNGNFNESFPRRRPLYRDLEIWFTMDSTNSNKIAQGKSLSLICGSLTWLRDHKRSEFLEETGGDDGDDEPGWMLEHSKNEKRKDIRERRKRLEDRLARIRDQEELQRRKPTESEQQFKRRRSNHIQHQIQEESEMITFELEDYNSDDQNSHCQESHEDGGLSASTLALLEKLKGSASNDNQLEDENETKIFYCSRTHSQISQFSRELQRVVLPASIPPEIECAEMKYPTGKKQQTNELEEHTKHISLGSRKTMCINPKVRSLGNATAINERCLDLQRPEVDQKCPYAPSRENEAVITDFRDHVLARVQDIEDIGKLGKQMNICPYYASRSAIKNSEIVTLPYPLLLQKSAREALDISLKDHIIIIDEAHNLSDVIANIYSVTISLTQLQTALERLTIYAKKFKTRLKGKNRVYVAQVMRLLSSMASYLQSIHTSTGAAEGIVEHSLLMSGKGVDQINPHKLSRYLHESKLARKIDGYVEHSELSSNSQRGPRTTVPVLFQVQSFILSLMNPSAEGRIFFEKTGSDVSLKYTLLDPTAHFREVVEDARAVILAGGTMSPMSDYADYLFSYLAPEKLRTFSYGHVIPNNNLIARPIVQGHQGCNFDFTFEKRNSRDMVADLGRTIIEMCRLIPDGVVVFFPSYDFLKRVINLWKTAPSSAIAMNIFETLGQIKPILHESQEIVTNTEDILQTYAGLIDKGKGAILLSVMGGKLSEGINFSDRLGRAVIIVGLPFPNIRSAIWQAKMGYVEKKAYERSSGPEESRRSKAKAASRDFYENSCMRVVNQCIGRAIRHQNDYAAILMLDRRYGTTQIQSKLPSWIRQSLVSSPLGITLKELRTFFDGKAVEIVQEK
ncbi:ATP-dependent DNA helicase chl1 [Ophidiomyces ophidiicola]|nr:ATP-dependent DNA helicase chl1 [Ophidiomyces ophidiicola]